MADDVTTVAIEVTAGNAPKAVRQLADAFEDAANKSGDLDGSLTRTSAGLAAYANKMAGATKENRANAAGFEVLLAQQKQAIAGYRTLAQAAVAAGKTDSLGLSGVSTADLQKASSVMTADGSGTALVNAELAARKKAAAQDLAAQAAAEKAIRAEQQKTFDQGLRGLSRSVAASVSAAREREAAEEAANKGIAASQASIAGSKAGGQHDSDVASMGRLAVAEKSAANAAKELAVAQAAVGAATDSGDIYAQAAAYEVLAKAEKSNLIATREIAAANAAAKAGLATQRYALYDVAQVSGIASAALIALAAAPIAVSISFEKSFANVKRTVQGADLPATANEIEQSFIQLTKTIPESFENISAIGALGGQLGIGAQQITNFTKVTAQFSATTNVGIEASGTALGRLSILIDGASGQYAQLASAILKTGVSSVATESQIISVAQNIASTANAAKFSASEIIGLSSAFASLGVPSELARSTIVKTFGEINKAIAGGGKQLQSYADLSGMSAKQFSAAWSTDASKTFETLLRNLGKEDGPAAQQTLDALGLTSQRTSPTLLKLAQNVQVLNKANADSAKGYGDTSVLTGQYGKIADTVASKLVIFKNNMAALAQSFGVLAGGPLAGVLGFMNEFVSTLTSLINNPVGRWVAGITLGFTALAGVLGVVATATILAAAAQKALATALSSTAINGATVGVRGLIASMVGLTTGEYVATAASTALKVALIAIPAVAVATAVGTLVAMMARHAIAFDNAKNATNAATLSLNGFKATLTSVYGGVASTDASIDAMAKTLAGIGSKGDGLKDLVPTLTKAKISANDLAKALASNDKAPIDSVVKKLQSLSSSSIKSATAAGIGTKAYRKLFSQGLEYGDAAQRIKKIQDKVNSTFTGSASSYAKAATGEKKVGSAATSSSGSLTKFANSMLKSRNASITMQNDLYALGQSLAENGKNFSKFSAAGRSNLQALQTVASNIIARNGSDVQTSINQIASLYNYISQNAEVPKAQLRSLLALQEALENKSGLTATAPKKGDDKQWKSLAQGVQDYTAAQTGGGGGSSGGGSGGAAGATDETASKMREARKDAAKYTVEIAKNTAQIAELRQKIAVTNVVIAANGVLHDAVSVKIGREKDARRLLNQQIGNNTAASKSNQAAIDRLNKANDETDKALDRLGEQYDAIQAKIDAYNTAIAANDKVLSDSVRTTSNYASDVSSIMSDAFNIDFGGITAYKNVADGWSSIASAADQANTSVQTAYQTLNDLKASDAVLQYQLGVANEFGDTGRAAELQAQIGSNHAQQATAQTSIGTAQAAVASSTDTSQLVGMTSDYGALIQQYIAAGYTGDALNGVINDLTNQFQSNGAALGFTSDQLGQFVTFLQTYKTVAASVPAAEINFGVTYDGKGYVSVDGILGSMANSLDQWVTQQDRQWLLSVGMKMPDGSNAVFASWWATQVTAFTSNNNLTARVTVLNDAANTIQTREAQLHDLETARTARISALEDIQGTITKTGDKLDHLKDARVAKISALQDDKGSIDAVGKRLDDLQNTRTAKIETDDKNIQNAKDKLQGIQDKLDKIAQGATATVNVDKNVQRTVTTTKKKSGASGGAYKVGGYTGGGGVNAPAGIVHGKEFVFDAVATKNIGVDALYNLQQNAQRGNSVPVVNGKTGNASNSGSVIAQLSPTDRQLLTEIAHAQALFLDGQDIAQNQSARNVQTTRRGSN